MPVAPPYFPRSFVEHVRAHDPAAAADAFRGKRVLVLCGKEDKLVPWAASARFVDALDVGAAEGGVKEVIVEEGVGHTCSPAMVKAAVRFLWEHALTQ